MKPRERVIAALRRQGPDRTPKFAEFTPAIEQGLKRLTGAEDLAAHFGMETRYVPYPFGRRPGRLELAAWYRDEELRRIEEGAFFDDFGVLNLPGSAYHFTRMLHPLEGAGSEEEIGRFPFPAPASEAGRRELREQVAAHHARDLFVGGFAVQIFEPAWYLRGMERLLEDLLMGSPLADRLLEAVTELGCAMARDFAAAGVDMLVAGDDVAMQKSMILSPELWRRTLKPRLSRVIRAAREEKPGILIFYHSDGRMEPIIADLVEVGVDVLNPVQPECVDPAEVKRQWGDRLSFWGTLGTQTTLPFGTPEEVRRVVRERITTVGRGGGLVLAPTHVVEPDVPLANILAFFEEAGGGL